ncbi:protein phosphatase 1 regulatory subunit 26 isoform X2 [Archocentrus centrarchus]|uniref:protein phosphatase 1 regulatory subunit 26 isoform X2 n=1 Tax=Archocentrus centrarchus TaxID=63155 RepID=UPI0011EA1E54|nr:protein phosphatase 1 regulatory subunit 26 isoform X2 [Archocentrus centrarchus]
MYLMNVPPVAVTQTEWRACGPPGGYSPPVCFNDSGTELSTRGTPISDKVQMIIESLRSTQSSLEMGDEIEGNVLSGQEGHPQVCKAAVGPYMGSESKTKSPTENPHADVSSPNNHESSDSDSDDSVDRGIEEAILEYLKEKDDNKRKAEPYSTFLPSSKIPRKHPSIPEVSKQNDDSDAFLIAGSHFPKSVKAETPTVPAVIPIKKYIKNKASLNENIVKNSCSSQSTAKSLACSKEQVKNPPTPVSLFNKTVKYPVTVKMEESNDSSSDDGIEEAIQRYQLEKKEQQTTTEAFHPHAFKEDSDSSSDDGIEEAIRCYQLEQLKEKSVLKPFLHKQKPFSKQLIHNVASTSTENMKKHKLRKKMSSIEKEVKSFHPTSSVSIPKTTLSDSLKDKGNGFVSFKVESLREQSAPAPPKVNTTAELMCAEAILDISKTVMPGAFHHSVGLSSCASTESSFQSSLPENCPCEESNDSSIDSEDGIEQEIRKFLEQKAQMHQQPPSSAVIQDAHSANEAEKVKARESAVETKPSRLSLKQRKKHKEKNTCVSAMAGREDDVKEPTCKPLPDHTKESKPLASPQRSQTHPVTGLHKTDQSGDKSSSLDSDEDLDTAIKDLLKTKKKSKKKMRDLKRKSRKCLKDEDPLVGNALQTKKLKIDPLSKCSALRKVQKSKNDKKDKPGLGKKSVSQHKQVNKSKKHEVYEGETEMRKAAERLDAQFVHSAETAPQIKEDSSSVDSDDSIEQEIRRFLAEKAKVSTAGRMKDGDVSRNGTVNICSPLQDKDIKQENQLAEIPTKSISPFSEQSPISSPAHHSSLQTPQSVLPDVSMVGAQSHLPSARSCSLSLLEPADGAGAARTEQRRPSADKGDVHMKRVRPILSHNIAHSRSEAIKWRQSLGLPTHEGRTVSRTPFHITSSEISDGASVTKQSEGMGHKLQTPVTVWSSARTSKSPFPSSKDAAVNTRISSPVLKFFSAARQHPRMSFARNLPPGQRSQCSIEGEKESMVHMTKDKSVFVELEANRTNHVQVQCRERSEVKERVNMLREKKSEGESTKIDNKDVHLEIKEEEFIDETDCESEHKRNPEKKQGFSTLSLSRAIDPGIIFKPCIALTSEERGSLFNRRYLAEKCKKGETSLISASVHGKAVQHVKRKLQFVPVSRRPDARSELSTNTAE